MSGTVVVVGSANVDLVSRVDRIPEPGETVTATSLSVYAGGKGLNQAVAARRAGATTQLVAATGSDDYGRMLVDLVNAEGMDAAWIRRETGPTGTAFVTIDRTGENNIVVVPGANGTLCLLTEAERELIRASDVLVCQLEVPDAVVEDALNTAASAGTTVVFNPTPVRAVTPGMLSGVDVLIVNEHEAEQLNVMDLAVPFVLTTVGSQGAVLNAAVGEAIRIPARKTVAVDTTGAGDTFVGYFAAGVAAGDDYETAARRASVAASLSVERAGAVPSIPTRSEVDDAADTQRQNTDKGEAE